MNIVAFMQEGFPSLTQQQGKPKPIQRSKITQGCRFGLREVTRRLGRDLGKKEAQASTQKECKFCLISHGVPWQEHVMHVIHLTHICGHMHMREKDPTYGGLPYPWGESLPDFSSAFESNRRVLKALNI